MTYAKVAFYQKTGQSDNILTYSVPESWAEEIEVGQSVAIKLRNRNMHGIIWEIHNRKPPFPTKAVTKINHHQPLLSKEQIKIVKWMEKYYFCPLHNILKLFIPRRVFEQKPIKARKKHKEQIIRSTPFVLNEEQNIAVDGIIRSNKNNFLIHGVTGSGKTEVYCQIAQHYIEKNQQTLILVPEIALTPQTIEYFESTLGVKATIINSKISEGERYQAWNNIWENKAKLVIGSRSAIFAPFQDLGTIIIDEEHENSYKQENSPRYSIHKICEQIIKTNPKTKIIFGSATPSIESATKFKESTFHLKERVSGNKMPNIEIVNLKEEFQKKNFSIFSGRLQTEIKKIIQNKEQAMLFINRRGSASSVVCRDCGYKAECPDCQIAMTFHARTLKNASLICHHCGKIEAPPAECPNCKGPHIRHLGIGTQRIESELKKMFPEIRTLRADKDTTSTKHGFAKIYQDFKAHKADILIGTQMIAKGLHLPKVSLVGVILADIGLNIPNFKSSERNFQLMTQVAGRAGRGDTEGTVIIQSYNPEHFALTCTKEHDYLKFYTFERQQRALLSNPPFGQLATLTISSPSEKKSQNTAKKIEELLWNSAQEEKITEKLEIHHYPSYLLKLKGNYRYTILIKDKEQKNKIHSLLAKLPKEYIMDSNIKIDIDPTSL